MQLPNNPRRHEGNQQHEASLSGTWYRGISVLGPQWTVTDDSLQVCRGINLEIEAPITQRTILLQKFLNFNTIGLFAPFSVLLKLHLKCIWTKNWQHRDYEVETGEAAEPLRRKKQLPIVAETGIERTYFNKERDKTELHVFADASEDKMYAVAYLRLQLKQFAADLVFVIRKHRVEPIRHLSIPRLELQVAVMALRLKEHIVNNHQNKVKQLQFLVVQTQLQFCSRYTVPIVSHSCLWPIEWLRYWMQLIFQSGNMWMVSTTLPTLHKSNQNWSV